jgi:hypothetical protein
VASHNAAVVTAMLLGMALVHLPEQVERDKDEEDRL